MVNLSKVVVAAMVVVTVVVMAQLTSAKLYKYKFHKNYRRPRYPNVDDLRRQYPLRGLLPRDKKELFHGGFDEEGFSRNGRDLSYLTQDPDLHQAM